MLKKVSLCASQDKVGGGACNEFAPRLQAVQVENYLECVLHHRRLGPDPTLSGARPAKGWDVFATSGSSAHV